MMKSAQELLHGLELIRVHRRVLCPMRQVERDRLEGRRIGLDGDILLSPAFGEGPGVSKDGLVNLVFAFGWVKQPERIGAREAGAETKLGVAGREPQRAPAS